MSTRHQSSASTVAAIAESAPRLPASDTRTTRWSPSRLAVALGLLAIAVLAAPFASAQEIGISLNPSGMINSHDSYDVISVDNAHGFGNYAITVEVFDGLRVAAEYEYGTENDTLFGSFDMDFAVHAALLAAEYRYPVFSWLHPHVRAAVGGYWGDIDLAVGDVTYDDTDFGIGFYALGGFDLVFLRADPDDPDPNFFDHLSLAVNNDYGYAFRPTLNFDGFHPEEREGAPEISLGEVDLSGFVWRVGLNVRYTLF
jgi:hypothetical protein